MTGIRVAPRLASRQFYAARKGCRLDIRPKPTESVAAPILSQVMPDVVKRTLYAGSRYEIKPGGESAQDFQGMAWKYKSIQDFGQHRRLYLRPVTRGNCFGRARRDACVCAGRACGKGLPREF